MDFWTVIGILIGILLLLAILIGVIVLVVASRRSHSLTQPGGYPPIQQMAAPPHAFKPLGVMGALPPAPHHAQPPGLQGITPPAPHAFKPLGIVGAPPLSPNGFKAWGPTIGPSPAPHNTPAKALKATHTPFQANGKVIGGYCFFTGEPKAQCTCEECQHVG